MAKLALTQQEPAPVPPHTPEDTHAEDTSVDEWTRQVNTNLWIREHIALNSIIKIDTQEGSGISGGWLVYNISYDYRTVDVIGINKTNMREVHYSIPFEDIKDYNKYYTVQTATTPPSFYPTDTESLSQQDKENSWIKKNIRVGHQVRLKDQHGVFRDWVVTYTSEVTRTIGLATKDEPMLYEPFIPFSEVINSRYPLFESVIKPEQQARAWITQMVLRELPVYIPFGDIYIKSQIPPNNVVGNEVHFTLAGKVVTFTFEEIIEANPNPELLEHLLSQDSLVSAFLDNQVTNEWHIHRTDHANQAVTLAHDTTKQKISISFNDLLKANTDVALYGTLITYEHALHMVIGKARNGDSITVNCLTGSFGSLPKNYSTAFNPDLSRVNSEECRENYNIYRLSFNLSGVFTVSRSGEQGKVTHLNWKKRTVTVKIGRVMTTLSFKKFLLLNPESYTKIIPRERNQNIILGQTPNVDIPTGSRAIETHLVEAIGGSDMGFNYKDINEDAVLLSEHNLFVVCDGMGGQGAKNSGGVASQKFIEALSQTPILTVPELVELMKKVANDVNQYPNSRGGDLVFASVQVHPIPDSQNLRLEIRHIGDAKIIIIDKNGHVRYRTKDQSTTQYTSEQKGLKPGSLEQELFVGNHPERNRVNNGMQWVAEEHTTIVQEQEEIILEPDETLLGGTDGVFDLISESEIAWIKKQTKNIDEFHFKIEEILTRRMLGIPDGRLYITEPKQDNRGWFILKGR